ncbi:MAG: Hsp20/alpha crystallin family protein [Promethearchaeia archaeon]
MTNIDDDFDALVREMLRRFFSGSSAFGPMMGEMQRIRPESGEDEIPSVKEPSDEERRVERIDLDDRIIIVIDGCRDSDNPEARIEGREVEVALNETASDIHDFEVPFAVDIDKSTMTFRNGIVEITLSKSGREDTSSDFNEGLLRPE